MKIPISCVKKDLDVKPVLRHQLFADDAEAFDRFGTAVSINSDYILIGGDMQDPFSRDEIGAVYIFNTMTGEQMHKIVPQDGKPGDQFGAAIASHKNYAVAGATLHDASGRSAGAAYIFDIHSGQQIYKLEPEDPHSFNRFGWSVGISTSGSVIVGSRNDSNAIDGMSGAAYLFNSTTGKQIHKLIPNTEIQKNDFYGWSVATSPYYSLVSAIGHSENFGIVYVFDTQTGEQVGHIMPSNLQKFDRFGSSVNITGRIAAISYRTGTIGGDYAGSVDIYDIHNSQFIRTIKASDSTGRERFGHSLSQNGYIIAVGSPMAQDKDGNEIGAIYIFDTLTGIQLAKINGDKALNIGSFLGNHVALYNNTVVSGAPYFDNETGVACVYDVKFKPRNLRRRRMRCLRRLFG